MHPPAWTRRDFLARTAAISALSCLMAPVEAAYHLFNPTDLLEQTFAALRAAQGSSVRIQTHDGVTLRARIAEVFDYRRPSLGSPYHQYSILFAVDGDAHLGQDVYRVEHPKLGATNLLLVPVLHGGRGQQREIADSAIYEAVITRPQLA